ncbi:cytochrome P450 81Q32-like [Corylus avellana]|uniref:cytochrome P450 81Q32-like n=1 Tax=Corylus avellana TaxID=13451 RepID=UPI00286C11CB|nr:cytochrome P450 81Q32-like [Corylus avellana]
MEIPFYHYILLFLFLYFLTKHLVQKSRRLPPSPALSLPIIGHLYLFKKPLHRTFAKLANQYGPVLVMRLGSRPSIIVSSPTLAEECFTKNDIVFANRPRLLAGKHLGYNYTTLAWAPYGHHWRNLRRIASLELLSSNRLQMFYSIRVDEVKSLIHRLCQRSEEGGDQFQAVDMKSTFFELTLNVMMRMIAGKQYYGENVEELEGARKFKKIVMESFELSGATNIGDFLPVFKWVGSRGLEKRLVVLQGKRDKFMQDLIEEHRRRRNGDPAFEERGKTMIDVLLSLQEAEPEYCTDEIIRGTTLVMLSAGIDTSARTMEWTLLLLLNNPETLMKAQAEIDNHIGQSRLIEESGIAKLSYLCGIINETLRMYPVAPLLVPHESSEECTLGGYHVPLGTMVLVNAWGIHNDPKIWGEPRKIKPERFQSLEGERKDGIMLLPFGVGRRGCLGEGFAMRIVGLALGSLIQCFEWRRIGKEMVDMNEGGGVTMPKAQPLLAMCRPRSTMVNFISQL